MNGTIIFILAIVIIVIACFVAVRMDEIVSLKGYEKSVFWECLLLGLPAWLYVVALPDLTVQKNQERIIELLENGMRVSNEKTDYEDDELPPL